MDANEKEVDEVRPRRRIIPPMYYLAAVLLMLLLHYTLAAAIVAPAPYNLVGVAVIALGLTLSGMGSWEFRKAGTNVRPFEESTALVTGGVFRLSRNPMYLGMTISLAGLAILMGTLTPWVGVIIFPLMLQHRFVVHEEQMMADTHGEAWQAYRQRVRRWI